MDFCIPEAYSDLAAGTLNICEIECVPQSTLCAAVEIHSVSGNPSAATLSIAWQLAPLLVSGPHSINSEASSALRTWQVVLASTPGIGHIILDGDWPANVLPALPLTAQLAAVRRIWIPPIRSQARIALTAAFTGGSAPSIKYSVAYHQVIP